LLRTPEGGLQPQVVADEKGAWHLAYLKGDPAACDVFYAVRQPGQTNFGSSIRVNSISGSAVALGTIRGVQLALGRNGYVHVAWNGSTKGKQHGEGASMYYTHSNEARNGFEPERNLMKASTALDGGGSVAADDKGNVFVVWHGRPTGGSEGEANRVVLVARSTDDGKTFTAERQVSPKGRGACGCCGLKAFLDGKGRLGVLYRAATGGTERDATLLISGDNGDSFKDLSIGPWRASTCPMSSMSLVQGAGDTWEAAWETGTKIQVAQVKLANMSCDVAEPDGTGKRKHPVVVSQGTTRLIAWVEDSAWAKGGSLLWELTDVKSGRKSTGRGPGVPAWSRISAVADNQGGFTIIY
jgi:hypothetical protein